MRLITVECRVPQAAIFTGELYNVDLHFGQEIEKQRMDDVKDIMRMEARQNELINNFTRKKFTAINKK